MTEELKARVSYLRGFAEGIDLGEDTKEEKVLTRIIDLLEDICEEIEAVKVDQDNLTEYAEAIDDDLTELEEDYYDAEDLDPGYEDHFDGADDGFSMQCPGCKEIVFIDDSILDSEGDIEVTCPSCGEVVLVDDEEWAEPIEELPEEYEKEE